MRRSKVLGKLCRLAPAATPGRRQRLQPRNTQRITLKNVVRPMVEGGEEALTSAAMALTGLAGLEVSSDGPVDPFHAVVTGLAANGVSHIISNVNGVRAERAAEKQAAKTHGHGHGHHETHGHSHGFTHPSATITAIAGSASYALGLALPFAGYHLVDGPGALAGSALGFFALGAFVSRFTGRGRLRSGMSQVLVGAGVMATSFAATTLGKWGEIAERTTHWLTNTAPTAIKNNSLVHAFFQDEIKTAYVVAGGLALGGALLTAKIRNRRK